jgi:hypothetical protein
MDSTTHKANTPPNVQRAFSVQGKIKKAPIFDGAGTA